MATFRFKQFEINQTGAPFKIGTDGLLLGSWATHKNPISILDVGTGTGLIALMLAQRFEKAQISAIDVNNEALEIAKHNFTASKWGNRIKSFCTDLQSFKPKNNFDLIVCNPPFFVNSKLSGNTGKDVARHTLSLSFEDLIKRSKSLLNPSGVLSIVIPSSSVREVEQLANAECLYLNRKCLIYPTNDKPSHRTLLSFGVSKGPMEQSDLILEENGRHNYSNKYKQLTYPFLLDKPEV